MTIFFVFTLFFLFESSNEWQTEKKNHSHEKRRLIGLRFNDVPSSMTSLYPCQEQPWEGTPAYLGSPRVKEESVCLHCFSFGHERFHSGKMHNIVAFRSEVFSGIFWSGATAAHTKLFTLFRFTNSIGRWIGIIQLVRVFYYLHDHTLYKYNDWSFHGSLVSSAGQRIGWSQSTWGKGVQRIDSKSLLQ